MAGTTVAGRVNYLPDSLEYKALVQINNIVADLETLRAALEASGPVAVAELQTNYDTNRTFDTEVKSAYNAVPTWATEITTDANKWGNSLDYLLTPDGVISGGYSF